MVGHAIIPGLRNQRQEDCDKFETSLGNLNKKKKNPIEGKQFLSMLEKLVDARGRGTWKTETEDSVGTRFPYQLREGMEPAWS